MAGLLAAAHDNARTAFTARLDASVRAEPGQRLTVFVNPPALHLFDPETGLAIGRSA